MLDIFKAPLFWFLFVGAGLFVIDARMSNEKKNTIVMTRGDIDRIAAQWRAQSGQEITPVMLDALIQEQIQERRLYREALSLNLEKDDVIIQRRLAQKLRFLSEDVNDEREVAEADLVKYYQDHESRYVTSSAYSFQHVYFSSGDRQAHENAMAALDFLNDAHPNVWESLGSPFILGRSFKQQSSTSLKHQFGQDFMSVLAELDLKKWLGPVESAYGFHLIFLEDVIPGHLASYESLDKKILQDYRAAKRQEGFEAFLVQLKDKYPAIIEASVESR